MPETYDEWFASVLHAAGEPERKCAVGKERIAEDERYYLCSCCDEAICAECWPGHYEECRQALHPEDFVGTGHADD